MKRKIYIPSLALRPVVFALALALFSGFSYSQNTYTFNYTGTQQTISLQAGTFTIEAWGADGGNNLGNGGTTLPQNGGKGGYARGTFTLASPTIIYVNVGGKGANSTSALNTTVAGGYNGGGYGSLNTTSGKSSGAGGGGATHVATAPGLLSALVNNTTSVRIVAGGGGGAGESNYASNNAQYNSNGGFGGGLSGLQNVSTSYQGRHGQGGTQTAGGTGGDNGSAIAGIPLQGIFGAGGFNPVSGANSSAGGSGIGGGGSGWYGGGAGWGGAATGFQTGSGGGGSSYIGGVTNATTIISGQPGFIVNPDVTGNGYVLIKEACSITLGTNNGNNLLCLGSAVTLTTNAISSYSWSTGSNASSITVSPSVTTSYALVAMSPSLCMTSAAITISVSNTGPSLTVTASSPTVCLGNTVSIAASGALSYSFSGGISNGVAFAPSSTTAYTVQGQNGCGTASAVTTITIAPLPVSGLANPSVVCAGSTASLAGGGATTYTWSPGNIVGANVLVSPQVSTTYTVVGSSGNCLGINTVVVNANPIPTITTLASNSIVCGGESVTLTANGALGYTWQPGNLTGSSIVVNPSAPTGYVVTGNNSFGCTSTAQQPVVAFASPTIVLNPFTTTICAGGSAILTASGANTYTWSTGPNTASVSVNPASTTVYTVAGTNTLTQCSSSNTVEVNVFIPGITASTPTAICIGESATLTASGANSYQWNTGGFGPSLVVTPNSSTSYTVTGVANSGNVSCSATAVTSVSVNPLPIISAVASRSNICRNESTTIGASGGTSYIWNNAATTASITVSPTINTTYSVEGSDANGCKNTASIFIRVYACVGLEENQSASSLIQVYPNPSEGNIQIESTQACELILFNEIGQALIEIALHAGNNFRLELNNLKPGLYFLSSKQPAEGVVKKVVIQR